MKPSSSAGSALAPRRTKPPEQVTPLSAADTAKLRQLIERWASAVREGDMEGVLAHHGDDVVMFDAPGPLSCKGIDAYRKTWDLFFLFQPQGQFDLSDVEIVADGSVAFCHALLTIGTERTFQARLTMGFRKVRGKWLIVHEHHSCLPD